MDRGVFSSLLRRTARRNLRLRDAIEDEATMAQVPLFGRFLTMVFTDFEKSKLAIASPFFSVPQMIQCMMVADGFSILMLAEFFFCGRFFVEFTE